MKLLKLFQGIVKDLRSRIVELEKQLDAQRQISQSEHEERDKLWEKDKRDLHILRVSLEMFCRNRPTYDIWCSIVL